MHIRSTLLAAAIITLFTACTPPATTPKIDSFSVSPPDQVQPGQTVTVSWEAHGETIVLHYYYHTTSGEKLFGDTLLANGTSGERQITIADLQRDDIATIEFSIQAYSAPAEGQLPVTAEYALLIPVSRDATPYPTLDVTPTTVPSALPTGFTPEDFTAMTYTPVPQP
jgi:hypothetical protein